MKAYNKFITSNGKTIETFDNLFTDDERQKFYDFCFNVNYKLHKGVTKPNFGNFTPVFVKSPLNKQEIDAMGLLETEGAKEFLKQLDGYECLRAFILYGNPGTTTFYHVDQLDVCDITCVYYANMEWQFEYGGDTVFSNDDVTQIEYVSMYTPGRIVLFDPSIPHKPYGSGRLAPDARFTIVFNFKKKEGTGTTVDAEGKLTKHSAMVDRMGLSGIAENNAEGKLTKHSAMVDRLGLSGIE